MISKDEIHKKSRALKKVIATAKTMNKTLNRFSEILKQKHLDGFIVTNPTNIFYLTGFRGISPLEREVILVFSLNGATLITARLYQNEAKKVASRNLKVKIIAERDQLFTLVQKLLKNTAKIGFEEDDLKYGEFKEFKEVLASNKLMPFKNLIEDLRVIKTGSEIKKIAKAQDISQKAFRQLVKILKLGQTEEEIAQKLTKIVKTLGSQGLAFETIVASGPNAGLPHYLAGNKKIKRGEVLLFDFGAKFENYHADLSRTIFMGKASDRERNIYNHVLAAQEKAFKIITHGLKASHAYQAANNYFKKHKLDQYFLHGLGHGVGLQTHERPHLRPPTKFYLGPGIPQIDEALAENMVFSVEPGLYFPWGGVRIEDLVVIKNGRAKVLGGQSAEFTEIK